MARIKNNILLQGTGGAIGKEVVLRNFKNGTFAGKFPDMSAIIPSKNQTKGRKRFAEAVKFAQAVMTDPKKMAEYMARGGYSVYHSAIKDYMSRYPSEKQGIPPLPELIKNALESFSLTVTQFLAIAYLAEFRKITNQIYRKMHGVSKPTATRHLQELAGLGIIRSNGGKGAGAFYIPGPFFESE